MIFDFLFGKKDNTKNAAENLNEVYKKLCEAYGADKISPERKKYLKNLINANGYLPYPYFKALDELTDAEVLFFLQ